MKIVLIGAGSRSFGRGQVIDLLLAPELRGKNATLALVDTDEAALATMAAYAERVRDVAGADMRIEHTADRRAALPGADYVLTAVARRRNELWEQDYRVPASFGFTHILGENGGPGALFHALRSFALIIPICEDVERICPDAWVFNFTNPESRVLHAVLHLTRVKAAGFCHGVFTALETIEEYTGRPREELEIVSAGINHFYAVLRVRDKKTGADLLPAALAKAKTEPNPHRILYRTIAEKFDVFTFPSDDHIGEYLSWGAEFTDGRWVHGRESHAVPVSDPPAPSSPTFEDIACGRAPVDAKSLRPSGELTVPIIGDIELDRGTFRPAVNVLNTGRIIENMPESAAVEVPATVDAGGIHPLSVGAIPEPFAHFLRTQAVVNELVTEAYRTRSRKLLLQALLVDPVVNSIAGAERLLDTMLELQREYVGEFE